MPKGCKTILICTEDIIPNVKMMKDKADRLDLIGQILHTGYGVKIQDHSESPAHQGTVVHPFSVKIRDRAHNTDLTLKILKNAERLSGRKQLDAANELLDEYDIYLERM